MLPDPELLPDVLPTDRLQQTGMPVPAVRADLRRISNARSAVTVVACLLQTFGVVGAAMWIGQWWAYVFAFLWMGRGHCLLNILGHEAAHRLLFTWRWLNDGVGKWLLAYPTFQAFTAYRRVHFAHHKDEMGPDEPDLGLYAGYPIASDSMRRKLTARPVLRVGLEEHEGTVAGGAGAQPRGLVHRRRAGSPVRHLHRRRPVVGLPSPLGRAVDDAVEAQQPPPSDRGARGHDPIDAIVASRPTSFVKAGSRG